MLGKKAEQLRINRSKHLGYYNQHKNADSMDFDDYYAKSGLNRAITKAWMLKKEYKGFWETLLPTEAKLPDQQYYEQHISRCLSLDPKHDFRFCLKALLTFLSKEMKEIKPDSYAFFLIKKLAVELNVQAEIKDLTEPNEIRDHFCSAVNHRYFYSDAISVDVAFNINSWLQ